MVVLVGNFALGYGLATDYPYIHTFQCMLERTDSINDWGYRNKCVHLSIPHCMAK